MSVLHVDIALLWALLNKGGPVVMVLIVISVLTLALILYKTWQFYRAGVGDHRILSRAVALCQANDDSLPCVEMEQSRSYLLPLLQHAFAHRTSREQLASIAEVKFSQLERGFRLLDSVAQLTPLLGLFGTVLGMIEAFQALQDASSQVDPSLLAGGIWVALLTTAVGLAIAMPTAFVLSWFEARMDRERVLVATAIEELVRERRNI